MLRIPSSIRALLHLPILDLYLYHYLFPLLYYPSSFPFFFFFFFFSSSFISSFFCVSVSFLHHPTTVHIFDFAPTTFFLYLCRVIIFRGMFTGERILCTAGR
jgi:hypothetical protein